MKRYLTALMILSLTTSFAQKNNSKQSNRHFYHSEETTAMSSTIWDIWTDVPHWKNWDTGLKNASIDGPFEIDTKGVIISLEGRKSKFRVIAITEGSSYTFKTKLPLSSLYIKRYISESDGKRLVTHDVAFKGLTSGIFASMFGKQFRSMLPEVVRNVVSLAESK